MPLYDFICRPCNTLRTFSMSIDEYSALPSLPNCPHCHNPTRRRYDRFTIDLFTPYYDHASHREITSRRALRERDARHSEEVSLRTGIPHDFESHDVREISPEDFGVTDEGLDATHDRKVALGELDPTPRNPTL
jgi:hypothetical protein